MRSAMVAAIVLCGCGGGLPSGDEDCGSHKDAQSCTADSRCAVGGCPDCEGGTAFGLCYEKGKPPPFACPAIACAPLCSSVASETECAIRSDCRADYCPGCEDRVFLRCSKPNDPLPSCPQPRCAPSCAEIVDAGSCNARPDCHSVYQPGNACGCAAAGCCTFFSFCASGKPYCKSDQLMCRAAAPDCAGPYVVAYANGCYEGCVLATACP